jgi:hypothetical protein
MPPVVAVYEKGEKSRPLSYPLMSRLDSFEVSCKRQSTPLECGSKLQMRCTDLTWRRQGRRQRVGRSFDGRQVSAVDADTATFKACRNGHVVSVPPGRLWTWQTPGPGAFPVLADRFDGLIARWTWSAYDGCGEKEQGPLPTPNDGLLVGGLRRCVSL